jgi:hypothetical protein
MAVNLEKSSEACVLQISKDDSTKSALLRLAPDQASLFRLLTADDFDVDGTPELNDFARKLTENRDPMRAVNMLLRQASRLWKRSIDNVDADPSVFFSDLSSAANDPDGMHTVGSLSQESKEAVATAVPIYSGLLEALFVGSWDDHLVRKAEMHRQLAVKKFVDENMLENATANVAMELEDMTLNSKSLVNSSPLRSLQEQKSSKQKLPALKMPFQKNRLALRNPAPPKTTTKNNKKKKLDQKTTPKVNAAAQKAAAAAKDAAAAKGKSDSGTNKTRKKKFGTKGRQRTRP